MSRYSRRIILKKAKNNLIHGLNRMKTHQSRHVKRLSRFISRNPIEIKFFDYLSPELFRHVGDLPISHKDSLINPLASCDANKFNEFADAFYVGEIPCIFLCPVLSQEELFITLVHEIEHYSNDQRNPQNSASNFDHCYNDELNSFFAENYARGKHVKLEDISKIKNDFEYDNEEPLISHLNEYRKDYGLTKRTLMKSNDLETSLKKISFMKDYIYNRLEDQQNDEN